MSLRIAVISTPRAGSTWLRHLLMEAYAIPGLPVHRPDDLDWAGLPDEFVLQLHWHRTPAFVHHLREGGFQVITAVRHPLDILISILQFCLHDESTLQWLNGEGGDERSIHGAMPGSAAFLEYGVGPRAAALMAVSREWTASADCLRVRYEDLVSDAQGELTRIVEDLAVPNRRPIADAVKSATMPQLRIRTDVTHHFWQGRPGLWRSLLIHPVVEEFAAVHQVYCADFGYACHADPQLVAARADANWLALIWPQVAEKLRGYRLNKGKIEAQNKLLRRLEDEYAVAQDHLRGLGPTSLAMARWLSGLSHSLPGPAATVKRLLRLDKPILRG